MIRINETVSITQVKGCKELKKQFTTNKEIIRTIEQQTMDIYHAFQLLESNIDIFSPISIVSHVLARAKGANEIVEIFATFNMNDNEVFKICDNPNIKVFKNNN